MKNNKNRHLIQAALVTLALILLGSCAVSRGTSESPSPPESVPDDTDAFDTAVSDGSGPLTAAEPDAGGLPELWSDIVARFATPDPEHPDPAVSNDGELPAVSTGATDTDVPANLAAPEHGVALTLAATDIWHRIRGGFALEDYGHARVEGERRWYLKHPAYMNRVADRAAPYLHYIVEEIEKRGMPTEIALLPIVESAFQPFAYSHGRAAGIWQFIPSTGEMYGLKQNWWYDGRRDITASTGAALTYLQNMHEYFDGDWLLALAAYNSGAGTVRKAIRANLQRNKPTDFWSLSLPAETSSYVPKLLALSTIVERPADYGIDLKPIPDEPYIVLVDTGGQVDLALAADLAGLSLEEIYRLNPGFNRWATDPDGPHQLVIPLDRAEQFTAGLAELPVEKRVRWARHRIRSGETLSHVARTYGTTIELLRQINQLNDDRIRAGHNLVIPVATKSLDNYSLSARQRLLATQNTPRSGGFKVNYVVQPGDSLWTIARKHKVNVNQLAAWNSMAPRDLLRAGHKLVIWPDVKTASTASPGLPATRQRVHYTVRRGDSLARISQRFNVRVNDVVLWNSLDRNKYLQPGQKLVLLVDVTVQAENI